MLVLHNLTGYFEGFEAFVAVNEFHILTPFLKIRICKSHNQLEGKCLEDCQSLLAVLLHLLAQSSDELWWQCYVYFLNTLINTGKRGLPEGSVCWYWM